MNEDVLRAWEEGERSAALARMPERAEHFETASGVPLRPIYTPLDVSGEAADELPGRYPYTRGIHATMYRSRDWTRRQVVGLGTAPEANERHRFVISRGQTGLSNDFDLPTITGHDSDHPDSEGEVGRNGVAIDTLDDMRDLVDGIAIEDVSTSMTINHPAAVLLSMYLAVADERGVPWDRLRGTLQNDPLKEFFAQKTFALPPAPSVRLSMDVVEFCTRHVPLWNPISLCGYQTRDCGGTADQEIGFTFAAAVQYIEDLLERGLDIDDFAPRLSFLMYVHMDFLEEVAKFRAARRLWARLLRERFGARDPRSWRFRVHVQTGAALLTRQQPYNNLMRAAIQCLAGALGGVQSMALSTFDEAFSIPSERAQQFALRTQQIVAYETGITSVPDPLAGSYLVESLTDELEGRAEQWMQEIEDRGGMLAVTESGWVEGVLSDQAAEHQQQVDRQERIVVGVNAYTESVSEDQVSDVFRVSRDSERRQLERLDAARSSRDSSRCQDALHALTEAAAGNDNLVPYLLTASRAMATGGEMIEAMRAAWGGQYRPPVVF